MWVYATIVVIISAFIFLVVALLAGKIVGPLYDIVINNQAVQDVGFDVGAETAMTIGLALVLPLMALTVAVWFWVLRLREDPYLGVGRR